MKIAYIVNSFEAGGAQFPIPDIVSVLRARGADVRVFGLSRKDGLLIPRLDAAGIAWRVREGTLSDHATAFLWLRRELRAFAPDLVWTSLMRATILGQAVASLMRLPTVHWLHTARIRRANAVFLRLFRSRAALWIADSPTVESMARDTFGLGDTLMCWPIFRVREDRILPRNPMHAPTIAIGTIGRLTAVKGYDVLCEAVRLLRARADLPAFRVFIAGEGPDHAALNAAIKAHELPVDLTGFCENPFEFLATLDVYVQTSHREGMCIAAHEAMSCGLPLVVTPAGQLPVTVEDTVSGLIVPFRDPAALADAIAALIADPDRRARMGKNAGTRVRQLFGADEFLRRGHAVLDRLPAFSRPEADAAAS